MHLTEQERKQLSEPRLRAPRPAPADLMLYQLEEVHAYLQRVVYNRSKCVMKD